MAEGKEEWKQILREFYPPFEKELEKVDKELEHVKLEDEVSDVKCDKCGRMMVVKMSRYGKFLACPGYPECKNIKPFVVTIDVPCPVCGGQVQVRKTKRGKITIFARIIKIQKNLANLSLGINQKLENLGIQRRRNKKLQREQLEERRQLQKDSKKATTKRKIKNKP